MNTGVREWISTVELPAALKVAVFDTVTSMSWLSGSAAKDAAPILSKCHPQILFETRSFVVDGVQCPLEDGQVDAVHQWSGSLTPQ